MSRINKITIKRITPPRPHRKKYSIQEILEAAERVKEAVEKEEKRYGKLIAS